MIEPGIGPRERILLYGLGGVGKSQALMTVARECPYAHFHVIDNDLSTERLLWTEYRDVAERDQVTAYNLMPSAWTELLDTLRVLNDVGQRDDWLSIDSITPTWDAVQSWFIEQQFGEDVATHMLKLRAQAKDQKEFQKLLANDMMWQIINKEYGRLYDLLLRWPGHLMITAEQTATGGDGEDREVMGMFGPYGVKPRGNKRLGHISSTTLLLTKSRVGTYAMTTIKDRGRPEMENAELTNFAFDYLVAVGKWKVVKNNKANDE